MDVRTSLLDYLHACPICGSTDLQHYCRVPSLYNRGEFLNYDRCKGCSVVLRNPRLPPGPRLERYEDRALRDDEQRLDPKSQLHYWYMVHVLQQLLPPGAGRRVLDLGCGGGGFLVEAKAAGFDVMGLELSRGLAEYVTRTYGIPVHQGLVEDPAFADERFDVILSSQVFEHLLDPQATLHTVRGHLNPGGLLLIEVPNLRDVREQLSRGRTMDDAHLFYFNRDSLTLLLRNEGLQVVEVHEGLRPFRFLGERVRRLPLAVIRGAERLAAAMRVRTVLSVIATSS